MNFVAQRNIIYFFIAAVFFFSGSCANQSDFSIENPEEVDFIGIYGKDTVEIQLMDDIWVLMDGGEADPVAVENFLYAFQNIEISGATKGENVDSLMSRRILMKVDGKKKIYRFYSGKDINLLHHEGSSKIFRITIKAAPDANLDEVFSDNPVYWRNRLIININPDEIRKIEVMHGEGLAEGFILERDSEFFRLSDLEGDAVDNELLIKEKILLYISYLEEIYYQEELEVDSIIQRISINPPFYRFEIGTEHEVVRFNTHYLYNSDGSKSLYYGIIELKDRGRYLKINYANLDVLFQNISYFTVE